MKSLFKKISLSSDHAGFNLKEKIKKYLLKKKIKVLDLGPTNNNSVDYPDYSDILVDKMKNCTEFMGILLCGTGIGMSIAANRHSHVRAALCSDEDMARLSRQHNDANVLVIGGRTTSLNSAKKIIDRKDNRDFIYTGCQILNKKIYLRNIFIDLS